MGYVPACGGNGSSRNASCSQPLGHGRYINGRSNKKSHPSQLHKALKRSANCNCCSLNELLLSLASIISNNYSGTCSSGTSKPHQG